MIAMNLCDVIGECVQRNRLKHKPVLYDISIILKPIFQLKELQ